jgi:hypothetical protein
MLGKKGAYGVINPVRGRGPEAERHRAGRSGPSVIRSTFLAGR